MKCNRDLSYTAFVICLTDQLSIGYMSMIENLFTAGFAYY